MSLDATQLDAFAQLATALGILLPGGGPNPAWFGDPVGRAPGSGSGNPSGLRHVLSDDAQRDALLAFVDEVLGAPDRTVRDGATWVPLFRESSPQVTIYAVVRPVADTVRVGLAVEHTTTGATPTAATRLHVPLFQLARGSASAPADSGGLPGWLLLGRAGGRIDVSVDLTLRDGAPPAGEASLGGLAIALGIPTAAADALHVALTLRDLQLPGASAPRTFTLDASSLSELEADAFSLIAGLVRAQADALDVSQPALRPFAALTGLLGLRDVPGLPPLPLAELTSQGIPALVGWVEGVLLSTPALSAWLGQLAILTGGTVDTSRAAVTATLGPVTFAVGVRVAPGTGGHPVLTPWAELALEPRAGARARLAIDVMRIDTQAGTVTAVPDLRAEAVFGQDAGGAALLAGDPGVGSLHVGIGITALGTAARRPTFVLTLEDVTVAGRSHPHLDLSSPQATVDAASSVLDDALAAALDALGPAAAHVKTLLGVTPPAGIAALSVPSLVANPVGEIARYWKDVSTAPAAMADALAVVRPLLLGVASAPVPGTGTAADPWRVALVGPLELHVVRDGDDLLVQAAVAVATPAFGEMELELALAATLLRAGFTPLRAAFLESVEGRLSLRRAGGGTASLGLGDVDIELGRLSLAARWAPATGFRVSFDADRLALVVRSGVAIARQDTRIDLPLPTFDASGKLVFPLDAWERVELAIGALGARLHVPIIDVALALVGWQDGGPRLSLAGLVGADPSFATPDLAIRSWLADLVLDCRRLEAALGPVASLVRGFQRSRPLGVGSAESPYRCPVAGHPRAPAFVAWLEPGCPPRSDELASAVNLLYTSEPPEPAALVAALVEASATLPDVADLLVGRDGLAEGLQQLAARWTGTDGVVVRPTTMPDDVESIELAGFSYDELAAFGSIGLLLGDVLAAPPAAVVHVGCEPGWVADRPAGRFFDLTSVGASGTLPATGGGEWYVRLPLPAAAAVARPDRGAVGEQAARLAQLLAARTEPIVVVGYGAAGAAAVRAAATAPAVSDVVTVGTPWAGLSIDAFRTGASGDALRFLARLLRSGAPVWPDKLLAHEATPLQQLRGVIDRTLALVAGVADLPAAESATGVVPSAGGETRRAGLAVHAVFGALDADTVARGIAAVCADGIAARFEAAQAAAGPELPHTALHVGVDVPVFDLDLGGLLVGVGATLELASLTRPAAGPGLSAAGVRGIAIDVHLGVHDGWLVGGPGALQPDADVRWMSARVRLPLDGRPSSPGDVQLVLHEARAFTSFRERWVVRADADGAAATTPLPEVKVIVSGVVARLLAASPTLGDLLGIFGLATGGGLDPDGLDRLLYDPADAVARALLDPAALAAALRGLVAGATGSDAQLGWTVATGDAGSATITFDLAARSVSVSAATTGDSLPPLSLTASLAPAGPAATIALGALDPRAGGVRFVGQAGAGVGASLGLQWQAPADIGLAAPRTVALLPAPDTAGLRSIAASLLPAVLAQAIAVFARANVGAAAGPLLDGALDVLGLLAAPDLAGGRRVRLPLAAFDAPGAWLRHGIDGWRSDPVGSAITLLDALQPLVAPGAAPGSGWPITPELTVRYAGDSGRLRLVLDADWTATLGAAPDGVAVETRLLAGVLVAPAGSVAPVLEAAVTVAGRGLQVAIAPAVRVDLLRPAPTAPLQLYPNGPGLGSVLAAAAESVLPPVLNALAGHRTDAAGTVLHDVGVAVFDVGGAMGLRQGDAFTGDRIATFAADPAGQLLANVPNLVNAGVAALAQALDPTAARVAVAGPTAGKLTIGFAGSGAASARPLRVVLDGAGASPAVEVQATLPVPAVGNVVIDSLRLSADGLQLSARVGPAPVTIGPLTLRPLVVVRAGVASGSFTRLLGLGFAFDAAAASSVEFRWALNASPPSLVAVTRTAGGESVDTTALVVATRLLALAASLGSSVAVEQIRGVLPARARGALRGVVFTDVAGSTELDAGLFLDFTNAPKLLARLQRMLLNVATAPAADGGPLSITIDGTVTIALVGQASGGHTRLGVSVSLASGKRFTFSSGDPTVELEVDATWVDPVVPPGLTILVVDATTGAPPTFAFSPAVLVGGVGLRFSKSAGPLLELGPVSLDAIAVHVYGEASAGGVGAGVQLELAGFAIAPSGAGGSNTVANGILNDASASGQANRPAFSPSLAVQKHPGHPAGVSLRAGPPPGPWWLRVQRQLGPLYVEQIGFDTASTNGRVTRVALLFDGRVSLFGLTAEVDQLSLTWLGGDVFDVHQWAVDLQGLAVSADMSGVSLAGGLLKTNIGGDVGYVGMLLGRFGVYGLSVFGGYTNHDGSPSFFVFGAFNGPIGGPPAFFLTGIGGGLGINRALRVPDDLARFNEYPFIRALDPAADVPDPMTALRELSEYFPPQNGNFWFAAGISFTCFALVDGIAVLSVSFGAGLEINLMGLARMALPRPNAALVSIELGLLARFSTVEGVFSIRAQLTENSWLLYPDVRLTGGFAFAVWWKGPLAGQFVLTIGGYHPSFHRDGYPEVPRLGLVWRVTDDIVVKGGSYFALTSEALMAGVDVEVSADFGWAYARIAFGANGIVYFDPFWFEVEAYARISAGVKIHTWFGTIRFSVSLGASVKVWGPDFSGEATIEVGPCSITVGFGSDRKVAPKVLTWSEFTDKYLENAGSAARVFSSITGKGTLPASTDGGQSAPTPDGSAGLPFEVFAEFEVSIVTTVPTQKFDLGLASGPVTLPIKRSDGATVSLGLKPMRASALTSTVRLTLEKLTRNAAGGITGATPIPAQLQLLGANRETGTDSFPIGAWGAPDLPGLPAPPLPKGDVIVAGNRLRLEAVATQLDKGPEIDYYRVESGRRPLPLQASGGSRGILLDAAAAVGLPSVATAQQALVAARAELFAARPAAPPTGVLVRGPRTNLARAAFAGERAAPPLFGTLADGLAKQNGADGSAAATPPKPPVTAPPMRPPRVTAWLAAGTGAAARAAVTTVADRRIKRRVAPTLASVQSRLAVHLPVQMVVAARPATAQGRTVIPTAAVPHTGVAGSTRAYVAGRAGGIRGLDALVGGLGAAAAPADTVSALSTRAAAAADPPAAQPIGAGDLVLLTLPDAARDVDETAEMRPSLAIAGQARVVMLRGDGGVLLDTLAGSTITREGLVRVPAGTALVAVQSDGQLDVVDGLAGWHERTRVAALGSHAALGTGCVLTIEAAHTATQVGWLVAADAVRDAAAVITRFPRPVRTVVVLLAESDDDPLADLDLALEGATRSTGADGVPLPPAVVLAGDTVALIYAVAGNGRDPVAVVVRTGGDRRLTGVLAGADATDDVARVLAERGVTAVAGRLLGGTGAGCTLRWVAPAIQTAPTTRVLKTTTTTATKTPAKKATAKKAMATKAPAKKAPAKKTTAKQATPKTTAKKSTSTKRGGRSNGRR